MSWFRRLVLELRADFKYRPSNISRILRLRVRLCSLLSDDERWCRLLVNCGRIDAGPITGDDKVRYEKSHIDAGSGHCLQRRVRGLLPVFVLIQALPLWLLLLRLSLLLSCLQTTGLLHPCLANMVSRFLCGCWIFPLQAPWWLLWLSLPWLQALRVDFCRCANGVRWMDSQRCLRLLWIGYPLHLDRSPCPEHLHAIEPMNHAR